MMLLDCVLLVDDNEADNFFHRRVIEEVGCVGQVVEATMAGEALDALRSGDVRPDLIFLDINMPRMNGWGFLEAYKELPPDVRKASVVIMLSTSAAPGCRERAEQFDAVLGFQTKPLTAESFKEVLSRHFPAAGS